MKIGIIGGGAIGLMFAANLQQNMDVILFTKSEQQAEAIRTGGIRIIEDNQHSIVPVHTEAINKLSEYKLDLIFLAVKQYHLPSLLTSLRTLKNHCALIFLQNGMGHLEYIKQLPQKHIFAGTVEHGAWKNGNTEVHIRGRNKTNLSLLRGDSAVLREFFMKTDESFSFVWKEQARIMMLDKMAANVVINPLTAVLKVTNGEIAANSEFKKLAGRAFSEFASVFIEDVRTREKTWLALMDICRKTAANRSSMLKDLEEGRPTEVDAIIGFTLKEGDEKGIELPFLSILYEMVKGLEKKTLK